MNIILILGGSGYVGTELIKELIKKNKVINYDLDLFGSDHLPYSSKNFLHIRGDIRDINKIKKVLKIYKPDICFHLAAQVEVLKALKEPYDTFNNNINLSLSLFESIKKTKLVKTIIHCSTDKVYGNIDKKKLPYKEYYSPNPIYPYDVSKYVCELIGQSYYDNYKIPIITTNGFHIIR